MSFDFSDDMARSLTAGLLDDAAVFPPGSAVLSDAVLDHGKHQRGWHAAMIGPLILPMSSLDAYTQMDVGAAISLTFPGGPDSVAETLAAADVAGVNLVGIEVAVNGAGPSTGAVERLADLVAARGRALEVSVEIPRGELTDAMLGLMRSRSLQAKLRVGGVRAQMYPDERELAESVLRIVDAGVAFKATAGLHRALRNTDRESEFEQHGFLNLLLATFAASNGATEAELVTILAERGSDVVSASARQLGVIGLHRARAIFRSFGTCSVADPINDLIAMGLVRASPTVEQQNWSQT